QARVVEGVGGGNFEPGRPVTREEIAAVLARLLTIPLDEDRDLTVPNDVTPENWSYEAILRAVNEVDFPVPTQLPPEET
ncbi:MAG: S-layer homology domain-containing protein, partial [Muribaculaceae bacterium]|nr:S-layer homology domain-containing protein [Muribaculaceae bacterium]